MIIKAREIREFDGKKTEVDVITVTGNLVSDPLLRTVNGKNGDIAVISSSKDGNMSIAATMYDKKDEAPEFFRYEIWGKAAEILEKYARKGAHILFYGRLKEETYTTKDGKEGTNKTVVVERMKFLNSKNSDSGADTSVSKAKASAMKAVEDFQPIDDEDIPF